jgi:hypothetical protein
MWRWHHRWRPRFAAKRARQRFAAISHNLGTAPLSEPAPPSAPLAGPRPPLVRSDQSALESLLLDNLQELGRSASSAPPPVDAPLAASGATGRAAPVSQGEVDSAALITGVAPPPPGSPSHSPPSPSHPPPSSPLGGGGAGSTLTFVRRTFEPQSH